MYIIRSHAKESWKNNRRYTLFIYLFLCYNISVRETRGGKPRNPTGAANPGGTGQQIRQGADNER